MSSAFFLSKKWALWAYTGLFVLLALLYLQTNLNVTINEWCRDSYSILQKPNVQNAPIILDINTTKIANGNAQKALENVSFINKASTFYYQLLNEYFFSSKSIATKEVCAMSDFYSSIAVFLCIALLYVFITAPSIYFASIYTFKWREVTTFAYLKFWRNENDNIKGDSQRIQEDACNFSRIIESLGLAFVKPLMILMTLIPILWASSKDVSKILFKNLSEDSISYFLKGMQGLPVYVALFISLGGLIISWFIGIKLPGLKYDNQKAETVFRKELVYAEGNRKDYVKSETAIELLTGLEFDYKGLFLHCGYFDIWLIVFEQMIVIVPFLIMGPSLFAGTIGLGVIIQVNDAFNQVRSSSSVFITN